MKVVKEALGLGPKKKQKILVDGAPIDLKKDMKKMKEALQKSLIEAEQKVSLK